MRRTMDVTIGPEGKRDAGKVFRLTELPAAQAEDFAARVFLAMARTGLDFPDDVTGEGLAGLLRVGLNKLGTVSWDDAKPLLDEMMTTVKVVPNPDNPSIVRPLLPNGDDIEEVGTRFRLRRDIVKLHLDFGNGAGMSTSAPAPSTAARS